MDNDFNVTYITFDGHVEVQKYRFIYFVIIFTAYILVICSNSTIVCIIVINKSLHEPMYIFIAALLINSVLFSTAIYPKLLIDFLSKRQIISYSGCLFQWFIYYTLACSEFLLLSVMAYDRYVSICKPLQYHTIMRKKTVYIFLILAWLLPACQISVGPLLIANKKLCYFILKGIICNSTVNKLQCVPSAVLNIYGLIVLVITVLLPVLFILFTYTRIFIVTYQSSREVRRKAAQTCLPHLLVLINLSCLSTYDVLLPRLETNFSNTVRLTMSLQLVIYHPLFNPIMYGLKMKEIYKHLKRLLIYSHRLGSRCRRKAVRWPLGVFCNILDEFAYNVFVVWRELRPKWLRGKLNMRMVFLEQLGRTLVTLLIERRERLPQTEAMRAKRALSSEDNSKRGRRRRRAERRRQKEEV
ncbi:olfactory receptor 10J4-like [Etheostoma cragini]|uniref:olfactory receptor 10J4-like n=1 Tax=Etheostoma cragini TaxID=417921 RepID=UPI00155E0DD3|nr:olfactory receptor 10J4-like [Etheostoma cragini]